MKVGIVGAGILGQLMALRLVHAGHQVTLYEQQSSLSNCSMVAAGLLTPTSELDKSEYIIYQLGQAALTQHWPHICSVIARRRSRRGNPVVPNAGLLRSCAPRNDGRVVPVYFKQRGCLVVHHPKDTGEWQHFTARIQAQLKEPPYQLLDKADLQTLEPELQHFQQAYYFPHEGQIDTQSLLAQLETHLVENGVIWHAGIEVLDIRPGQITTAQHTASFDTVIDCRGLGAKAVFPSLRGIRGEIIHLHAPDVTLSRPIRLLHPRYSIYIVPRPNHHYLIGASELETEDLSPISVQSMLELLSAAYSVHRGFDEARVIKTATQVRPTLPDHLPRILKADGLIAINGLYRHGYLIAPTLVEAVYQYLENESLTYTTLWEAYHDYDYLPQ